MAIIYTEFEWSPIHPGRTNRLSMEERFTRSRCRVGGLRGGDQLGVMSRCSTLTSSYGR